ncbi:MAG TPA: hypothetical protein EYH11_04910 [Sulfurimonas autotrophica]|nr:hypothetical protein [Sulfurimonas autotrophica]
MQILCTNLFEEQLKNILQKFAQEDLSATKNFKVYLDTVIINIPTKAQKYKKSIYFDDENIKDLEHQGFIIPFYIDQANDNYLILGIVEK